MLYHYKSPRNAITPHCKSTLTTTAYKGNRINKTSHNTELKSPKLTQQSLWKAGPAFTQRCWLKNGKLLKSEVTPYIKERKITQVASTANTMNGLSIFQPPGSR